MQKDAWGSLAEDETPRTESMPMQEEHHLVSKCWVITQSLLNYVTS